MLRQTTKRVRGTSNTTDIFFDALNTLYRCTNIKPVPHQALCDAPEPPGSSHLSRKNRSRAKNSTQIVSYQLMEMFIPLFSDCNAWRRRQLSHYWHPNCNTQRRSSSQSAKRRVDEAEYTFSTVEDNVFQEESSSPVEPAAQVSRTRTQLPRPIWPQRLQKFLGSLPVRNYANDFVLWDMTADDVWARYQLLREPRCVAVSRTALSFILSSLATEKPRTRRGMLRFAEVINEMKTQVPPLIPTTSEWTALISFVGRLHKNPLTEDVDKCLEIWDEMEGTYNVKANLVTFNVLLDVSIKARRWQTADSLLKEMQARDIHYDRYTWTTLLYGAGLRRDGNDVRRLSRAMLDSGEVLDILVINAIISALFRCGESAEAEHLFEHISRSTTRAVEASRLNYFFECGGPDDESQRTSLYQQRARTNRAYLKKGDTLTYEDTSPRFAFTTAYHLAPDIRTFNMVLSHHCTQTGNFARANELLEAMEKAKIPDSIAMFRSLFSGFRFFGGRDKEWNLERLQYVFRTMLAATEIRLTRDLAVEAIQAFAAVGSGKEIEQSWQALDGAWQCQGGSPLRRSLRVTRERDLALRTVEGHKSRTDSRAEYRSPRIGPRQNTQDVTRSHDDHDPT